MSANWDKNWGMIIGGLDHRILIKLRWQNEKELTFLLMRLHFIFLEITVEIISTSGYAVYCWESTEIHGANQKDIKAIPKDGNIRCYIYHLHNKLLIRRPWPFFIPFYFVGTWSRVRRCLEVCLSRPRNAERRDAGCFFCTGKSN